MAQELDEVLAFNYLQDWMDTKHRDLLFRTLKKNWFHKGKIEKFLCVFINKSG